MPLRQFIAELERRNDLQRISAAVSPDLELAAITDRICKREGGGTALIFEDVTGFRFPIATNLFGSYSRMAQALSSNPLTDFGQKLDEAMASADGKSGAERLRNLLNMEVLSSVADQRPPCREITAKPDLTIVPAMISWPQETLPSLTLPLVFTVDPDNGEQNCGMYRVQRHGPDYGTINFGNSSGGALHWKAWQKTGRPMPVAIVLGGDPTLIWAAGAPLPQGCDELRMAAWLSGKPQSITPCLSQPLQVPAAAEFVIEGFINPGETATEGPFGNHTGGYVANPAAPLFRVTSISHRSDAICPATLVGPPPMEDCYLAKTSERLLLALMKIDHPQIRELHMPMESIFHGCALIATDGLKGGEGIELLHRLRSNGPLKNSKLLILLDADIDIRNPSLSYWRIVNRLDKERIFTDNGRISIDATGIDPAELIGEDTQTTELVTRRWSEYGLE